jgi:plastocyanin
MPEEQEQETIIDQLFNLLEQLLIPNWSDLFKLLPWVLVGLVLLFVVHTARQWRRASERTRPRVPRPLAGGAPPPGVHMPGPSRWPFVVPIGAALLLFALVLPARDASGDVVLPFNLPLLIIGLLVTLVAIAGWLLEAMREWRATATGGHAEEASAAVALTPGRSSPALSAGQMVGVGRALETIPAAETVSLEPPPGVHMPGPSPWPFFAPIALVVMLYGAIFSTILLLAGIVLGVIAAAGWLLEAGHEYRSTEEVGHAVPKTRDAARVWPRRLVPIFAGVIALGLFVTLAPVGLAWLNSFTPAEASPTPVAVPEVPEISASNAVSFDISTLVVPAARPFDLVFQNNDDGVPHNVEIAESAARATKFLEGEVITGVASITYQVPELAEGNYYFLCSVHPNMNGTVQAMPETGGPAPGPGGPNSTGVPGQSPGGGGAPSGDPPAGNPGGEGSPVPQASPAP